MISFGARRGRVLKRLSLLSLMLSASSLIVRDHLRVQKKSLFVPFSVFSVPLSFVL
jgi:hypothetical protein